MSSPWGKIAAVETANFADIMSEEYARDSQDKEIKKFERICAKADQKNNRHKQKTTCESSDSNNATDECLWNDSLSSGSENASKKISYSEVAQFPKELSPVQAEELWEDCSALLKKDEILASTSTANKASTNASTDKIPNSVLEVLRQDASELGCDSDMVIAQMLQSQYDHDYNEELKRIENQRNKHSKVSVSLDKFRRDGFLEMLSDDENDEDYDDDCSKRDWDRFETNEKIFEAIPKCGFKVDKEGEMITKHDAQICGVRNACRVMSFPPEFPTGDAAGFEMKLSNQVFNQLKTYSRRGNKKSKMNDRKENVATAEMGVDAPTRLLLYKLINNQILEQINGIISTGKEAVILHANSDPLYSADRHEIASRILPKECAIKIFKTTLNEFKQRDRYIKDDYRFKDRFSKQNNRVIINMWAEKEMHNMMRMQSCGINCPDVVVLKKHVLVMSFIGDNHNAAPKLKDSRLTDAELSSAYDEIIEMMYKMYNEAKLVHADLSEYNILWYDGKCWFIDVAQSVEPEHPSALEFLMRDCTNIINFFTKRGLPKIFTKEQLFEHITSLNAETHNAAMLERIHTRGASIKQATAPNQEECPDEIQPIAYPFDLAWEKSQTDRKLIDTADAMKELNLKCGVETKPSIGGDLNSSVSTATLCKN